VSPSDLGTYIIGGILDTLFSCVSTIPAMFVGWIVMLYFQKFRFWLEMIINKLEQNGLSIIAIRQYQLLQTINKIAYATICPKIIPTVHFCGYMVSLALWTSIVTSFKTTSSGILINFGVMAVVDAIGINLLIEAGGCVLECSRNVKRSLGRSADPLMRKYIRSCRDLRVYAGSVFFYEKSTVAVFVDSVINNMITIILMF